MKYYIGKIEITEEEWQELAKKRIKLDGACFTPNTAKSAMDVEIEKKGAIIDNMGNKHTTAQSYKNYLKDNNLVIRDWSLGSNAGSRQFKGCQLSDIPKF
jgi:hypothetical protein